jgi:glycosyltransferase involved in cell wall biosynthesis
MDSQGLFGNLNPFDPGVTPESEKSHDRISITKIEPQNSILPDISTSFETSAPTESNSVTQSSVSEDRTTQILDSSKPGPTIPSSLDHASGRQARARTVSFSNKILPLQQQYPSSVAISTEEKPPIRRISKVGPFKQTFSPPPAPSACPPRAHLRSKSLGAATFNGFRNPFAPDGALLPVDGQPRRESRIARAMSVVNPENPIPRRYRSKSVSSLGFFFSSLESSNTTLPIFHNDMESQKENIQQYLAGVERLQASMTRRPWQSNGFRMGYLFLLITMVYFLFIGWPVWHGLATLYYTFIRNTRVGAWGCSIFMGWGAFQTFVPLLGTRFEQEVDDVESRDSSEVSLVIPAYKAAAVLPETIKAALKIFKPEQIFIIANGSSEEPLDNTAEVCSDFGVNHAWVPVGNKLVAEFVGVALASSYKYMLLIDDDVHLPSDLPIVTDRLKGSTKCIGYTIKSTGADGIKGTYIQQCQDMEYKVSGLTRVFCGKYGSATFPHGAIILWESKVLRDLFNVHPGYVISEDWYFGHAARSCGFRIEFCSQVFVETETPPAFFKSSAAVRGGFGEMTVYKQRFGRWNYFFVLRIWEDTIYVLLSWRMGWREVITKIWVMEEVYTSVMALLRPFAIVITALAAWQLLLYLTIGTTVMYILSFVLFNEWHLRKKNEMISYKVLPTYLGMKFVLMWVNTLSAYYGIWDYAKYFSVRHPKVIENYKVLEIAHKIKLGTKLVPLDTRIGEATREVIFNENIFEKK